LLAPEGGADGPDDAHAGGEYEVGRAEVPDLLAVVTSDMPSEEVTAGASLSRTPSCSTAVVSKLLAAFDTLLEVLEGSHPLTIPRILTGPALSLVSSVREALVENVFHI